MSLTYRPAAERRRLYRAGWIVAVFTALSFVLVAFAEQGSTGTGLRLVPDDPLPFERHAGIGIDLTGSSSLQALDWLESVDVSMVPVIIIPLDGDIVAAFNNPDTFVPARIAVDHLITASDGATLAFCLRRPITALDERVLAEAAVSVLAEHYSDEVTYIGACIPDTPATWVQHVLATLNYLPPSTSSERILAPLTLGAPLRLQDPTHADSMDAAWLDSRSGTTYAAVRMPASPQVDDSARMRMWDMLHDRTHIGLALASPVLGADAATFVNSLSFAGLSHRELSEGFNNVSSQRIAWHGEWTETPVGPVTYQRTLTPGSWLTAEFIGTEVWIVGIASPDGGRLGVWIDAGTTPGASDPDRVFQLTRVQARDSAVLAIDGLPAARHQITLVAADGEVAISGIFVTGRSETGLHGMIGSIGMIAAVVAGLVVVLGVAVDDLRIRIGLDRPDDEDGEHPRIFRREV